MTDFKNISNDKFLLDKQGPNDSKFLKQITHSGIVYDVIYNVFFHQSVKYINDFVKNVQKFNKNNKYLIVAHLSKDLYKNNLNEIIRTNLLINPCNYNKKIFTWQLTQSRLENYQYVKELGIKFNHMNLTVATGRFVKQVPHYPLWENNESYLPQFGYRVKSQICNMESVHTYSISNSIDNQKDNNLSDDDYSNTLEKRNNNGISVWWVLLGKENRDANFVKKFLIPFMRKKGIHVSIELINTWMCSSKTMEKMNNWFYNSGLFSKLVEEDPKISIKFPLDELLFPSLSRHFEYNYNVFYNNTLHYCFPQTNNGPYMGKISSDIIKKNTQDENIYYFKKIPENTDGELYKSIHQDLKLV